MPRCWGQYCGCKSMIAMAAYRQSLPARNDALATERWPTQSVPFSKQLLAIHASKENSHASRRACPEQ